MAYGAPDLLDACLDSLRGALPVTVVDNSSNDAVRRAMDNKPAKKVIIVPQRIVNVVV